MRPIKLALFAAISILLAAGSWAQPKVTLELVAETEIVVEENGKQVTKLVVAEKIEPGKEIIYTLKFKNDGDEPANNVKLNNKIPEETAYVDGSAWGEAEILFSIDNGASFKKASELTYEVVDVDGKKVKQKASAEIYTDIVWMVKEIPAGGKGSVGFRSKVK